MNYNQCGLECGSAARTAFRRTYGGFGNGADGACARLLGARVRPRCLSARHIGNGVLVEDADKGVKRIVKNGLRALLLVAACVEIGRFDNADDLSNANLTGRTRELYATVAAAHGLHKSAAGQQVYDLKGVLLRDVQALGNLGDLDKFIARLSAVHQYPDGVIGSFVEAH